MRAWFRKSRARSIKSWDNSRVNYQISRMVYQKNLPLDTIWALLASLTQNWMSASLLSVFPEDTHAHTHTHTQSSWRRVVSSFSLVLFPLFPHWKQQIKAAWPLVFIWTNIRTANGPLCVCVCVCVCMYVFVLVKLCEPVQMICYYMFKCACVRVRWLVG